ncbi:MAG: hypothetical protein ACK5UE_14545 [Chitinophagales bacterium]|jgi:hypothetical protein|nr:hypothetical protein [Sphingobacteriales bacterium]
MDRRILENFHVLLWLIKDLCWAMEFQILGSFLILPTIAAAIWILIITKDQNEFWVNLAVLFWIMANSTWMLVDFFQFGSKYYSLPSFICGFISFGIYCYKLWKN